MFDLHRQMPAGIHDWGGVIDRSDLALWRPYERIVNGLSRRTRAVLGHSVGVTAEEMMEAGNEILGRVLGPAGFLVGEIKTGEGSGGHFAICRWTKGSQFIELHARWALGIVNYGWGDQAFDQGHVVGALAASASYPGFSDDPLDGFRHLADDLAGPLSDVLGPENRHVLERATEWKPPHRVLP
jgi:hypothetical protein